MKKLALLLVLVAAVAGSVVASGSFASGGIVAQATNFDCGVSDAFGNVFVTDQSSSTLYSSGKEQLHCVGQGAGNGSVVVQTGFLCGMFFTGVSSDPNNIDRISKSGESQLTCYNLVPLDLKPSAASSAGAIG